MGYFTSCGGGVCLGCAVEVEGGWAREVVCSVVVESSNLMAGRRRQIAPASPTQESLAGLEKVSEVLRSLTRERTTSLPVRYRHRQIYHQQHPRSMKQIHILHLSRTDQSGLWLLAFWMGETRQSSLLLTRIPNRNLSRPGP